MYIEISTELKKQLPPDLVDKLLETFIKMKEDYYLGNYRSASFEAGRFSEIALRMIQYILEGTHTSLNLNLPKFHDEVVRLGNITGHSDTVRFHIPRTLEVIHDIRNKRDVGHPKAELDANYSDATLSLYSTSWILAELIRIFYTNDIDEAQKMVDNLMQIQIPIIQEFNGFLKILDQKIHLKNKILLFSLYKKDQGITIENINEWTKQQHRRDYIAKVLNELETDKAYLHSEKDRYFITRTGILEIFRSRLLKI